MEPVETFQEWFELDQLAAIYQRLKPERVLEIGCWKGGTLQRWLSSPHVVAVDDAMRDSERWHDWAAETGCDLHLIQGNSSAPGVVETVRRLGPYGFVFIDGDHTLDAVKADWANYRPMISRGGVCVFHDIVEREDYGVSELWAEIKQSGRPTIEIIQARKPGYCGVGAVWV